MFHLLRAIDADIEVTENIHEICAIHVFETAHYDDVHNVCVDH